MKSFISTNAPNAQAIALSECDSASNHINKAPLDYIDEKWPPLYTALFILLTCGGFWLSIAFFIKNLIS